FCIANTFSFSLHIKSPPAKYKYCKHYYHHHKIGRTKVPPARYCQAYLFYDNIKTIGNWLLNVFYSMFTTLFAGSILTYLFAPKTIYCLIILCQIRSFSKFICGNIYFEHVLTTQKVKCTIRYAHYFVRSNCILGTARTTKSTVSPKILKSS